MSQVLNALNFEPVNIMAQTDILTDAEADQDTIAVLNTASFEVGKTIILGEGENAEMVVVESLANQQIVATTDLKFKHLAGERVGQLVGNAVKFYRAADVDGTTPGDGSFSVLATVPIVPDQPGTYYTDTTGSLDYWYKYIYIDTNNPNDYTALADSVAVRGGNYGIYATVEQVRDEAGLQNNTYITDQTLYANLVFAQGSINSALSSAGYTLPLDSVPAIIEHLAVRLAAGYTLRSKALVNDEAIIAQGNAMVEDVEAFLTKLSEGKLELFDNAGNKLIKGDSVISTAFSDTTVEPWFTRDKTY